MICRSFGWWTSEPANARNCRLKLSQRESSTRRTGGTAWNLKINTGRELEESTECWLDIFGKSHTSHHLTKIDHLKPRGQNYPPWKWTAGSPQHHRIEIRKIESEPSTSMTTGGSSRWFSRGGTNKNPEVLKVDLLPRLGWPSAVKSWSESMNCISNQEMFLVGTNPVVWLVVLSLGFTTVVWKSMAKKGWRLVRGPWETKTNGSG